MSLGLRLALLFAIFFGVSLRAAAEEPTPPLGDAKLDALYLRYKASVALRRDHKYDAAIAELSKVLSELRDRPTNNYAFMAAKEISYCYGAKGDMENALKWALETRDKYQFNSGCGTCNAQERDDLENWLLFVLRKVGKKEEAFELAEKMALKPHMFAPPANVPMFVVEEHLAQGKRKELLDRVNDNAASGVARLIADELILPALAITDVAEQGKLEVLWSKTMALKVSASRSLVPNYEKGYSETVASIAAQKFLTDPTAVPLLKRKLRSTYPSHRGWAAVLLAKRGELKSVDEMKVMAMAIPARWHNDEAFNEKNRTWQDFGYAALLIDPNCVDFLRREFAGTPIGDAFRELREYIASASVDYYPE